MKAVTKITIRSEVADPLDSIRKALAFADEMVALGAAVDVTGDLDMTVRFDATGPFAKTYTGFVDSDKAEELMKP